MNYVRYTYEGTAGVDATLVARCAESLNEYRRSLADIVENKNYEAPEASLLLASDDDLFAKAHALVNPLIEKGRVKVVLILGIGGSSLGSFTLYSVKQGWFDAYAPREPKLLYLDALSPSTFVGVTGFLDRELERPEEVLVCVVSKSGNTVETITYYELIFQYLSARFTDTEALRKRFVFFSDTDSPLAQYARDHSFVLSSTPKMIGGRFSVCAPSHLIPAHLGGVDVDRFRRGAVAGRSAGLSETLTENPALAMASVYASWMDAGYSIHNLFIFSPQLAPLGAWYRQLFAESLGKGGEGMLPVVSIGSSDLHSVAQLYFGGARNIATTFVGVENSAEDVRLPDTLETGALIPGLGGKTMSTVHKDLFAGVREQYVQSKLSFAELTLADTSEESVGACMQSLMLTVMYVAHLRGISAFDQPDVEGYKRLARAHLTQ